MFIKKLYKSGLDQFCKNFRQTRQERNIGLFDNNCLHPDLKMGNWDVFNLFGKMPSSKAAPDFAAEAHEKGRYRIITRCFIGV